MKRTSIRDVAKKAGVSITTVSNALTGKGTMKDETRAYVTKIAQEMMYFPDFHGSSLKSSKSYSIAFFTDALHGYYVDLALIMKSVCEKHGYEMEVFWGNDSDRLFKNLLSNRIDGAIILNQSFTEDQAGTMEQYGIPVVYMDRVYTGDHSASVLLDSYHAGELAACYLHGLGHRRLMMIKGRDNFNGNQRFAGFTHYLAEQGIALEDDYCIEGRFSRKTAYAAMKEFLTKGLPLPEAVFAANDESAFACVQALREAGYSVPQDVSVMGCDDVELCQWFVPPMTTINPDAAKQGKMAAEQMLQLLSGNPGCRQTVSGHLVLRESCRERGTAVSPSV